MIRKSTERAGCFLEQAQETKTLQKETKETQGRGKRLTTDYRKHRETQDRSNFFNLCTPWFRNLSGLGPQ